LEQEVASLSFVALLKIIQPTKMKRTIQLFMLILFSQQVVRSQTLDTVSTGAGYANQVWYSLANDNQGVAPKNNWDIAFDVSAFGATVLSNTITGTLVWQYTAGDTADWATLDTTGLSTWPQYYNSDTSWALGAFNQNPSSSFDMGWGMYNSLTHYVTGDSLYIVKLADNSYRKFWIKLLANGAYEFRYANLNNTGDQTVSLNKTTYSGKNFAYYSMQNNSALDREPLSANWDLLFSQYTTFIPSPYTVTGVLSNIGVTVAQANPVNVNTAQWTSYSFVTPINEIGYDWKAFNMTTFTYDITDSLVYFVQSQNGDVWKVIFTGFGGSANGNYIFTKELVSATGIAGVDQPVFMELYPNPATDNATLSFSTKTTDAVLITVTDLTGKICYQNQLQGNAGLQQSTLQTSGWPAGMYIVTLQAGDKTQCKKLIVQ
jgi:hypothetical protein